MANAADTTALATAKRIRAAVEGSSDPEVGTVTLSLGCAQSRPDESIEALVRRVDMALYRAKNEGRNRVQTAANGSATGAGDAVS